MDGGNVNSIGLKIQQVLRSDMGNYTCELQNEYGVGESQNSISLDVHCKYNMTKVQRVKCYAREYAYMYGKRNKSQKKTK